MRLGRGKVRAGGSNLRENGHRQSLDHKDAAGTQDFRLTKPCGPAGAAQMVWLRNPPSTRISVPVMKLLAWDAARKPAAPLNSCDSPNRFMGVCPQIAFVRAVGVPSSLKSSFRFCSAGKKPGVMVFTRTPLVAHSRARNWERLNTAALLDE